MEAQEIINLANRLKETYKTNNPFNIAQKLGVKVEYFNMRKRVLAGNTLMAGRNPIIGINKNFNDITSQVTICAHELGHVILHKNDISNHFEGKTINETHEYEANLFAVALLFDSNDFDMKLSNMSNYLLKNILEYNINYND